MPISDHIPAWLALLRADGKSPRTLDRYARALRAFVQHMGDIDAQALDLGTLRRFKVALSEQGNGPATIRLQLAGVTSLCDYLVDEGVLLANPARRVKKPKSTPPPPKPLAQEEIAALLAALRQPPGGPKRIALWQRNRRAVLLMLYAGLRLGEVVALRWKHIDLARGVLLVERGKGGKARSVPIHPNLVQELSFARQPRPDDLVVGVMHHGVAHIFDRWLPARGVEGITAHRLRHTFATWLHAQTGDLLLVSQALGHASVETTQIYVQLDAQRLTSAVCGLDY
jgi:site-specific recombinase XerC